MTGHYFDSTSPKGVLALWELSIFMEENEDLVKRVLLVNLIDARCLLPFVTGIPPRSFGLIYEVTTHVYRFFVISRPFLSFFFF